jgi:hypothetical protein
MTARRRDGKEDPRSFNAWTRRRPEIDSKCGFTWCDLDVVWHQYGLTTRGPLDRTVQNIIVIETKSMGAPLLDCQRDTLRFLHTHYKGRRTKHGYVFPVTEKSRDARGRVVTVRYWGIYLLEFSGFGPDDSERIMWNRKIITVDQLLLLLQFKIHPVTFRERDERDHHGKADQGLLNLTDDDDEQLSA